MSIFYIHFLCPSQATLSLVVLWSSFGGTSPWLLNWHWMTPRHSKHCCRSAKCHSHRLTILFSLGSLRLPCSHTGSMRKARWKSLLSFLASFLRARNIKPFLLSRQLSGESSRRAFPDVFSKAEMWRPNPLLHLQQSLSCLWSRSNLWEQNFAKITQGSCLPHPLLRR